MKFELWYIGKSNSSYSTEGITLFTNRLNHYANFHTIQIDRIRNGHKLSKSELKAREGQLVIKRLLPNDYLIILDEHGKTHSSVEFANWIDKKYSFSGLKRLIFLIGGIYGFDNIIKERANYTFSLSKLTLPHELARLVFVEQLYRAFTILKNDSYHNA